jgi:hypothetical protein
MILEQKVLLTQKECQDIIVSTNDIWYPSLLGKDEFKPNLRKSFVHNKRPKKGEALYEFVSRGLSLVSEELVADELLVSILKYEEGGFIYKHKDDITTGKDGDVIARYYMICLLNDKFEGGTFVGYDNNDKDYRLNKLTGNVLIGDPTMYHEVEEVLSGTRYNFICFIQHQHLKPKLTLL